MKMWGLGNGIRLCHYYNYTRNYKDFISGVKLCTASVMTAENSRRQEALVAVFYYDLPAICIADASQSRRWSKNFNVIKIRF